MKHGHNIDTSTPIKITTISLKNKIKQDWIVIILGTCLSCPTRVIHVSDIDPRSVEATKKTNLLGHL
jgi:hypothetical protein